jgi:hypothetical protein
MNCGAVYEHSIFNRVLVGLISLIPLVLPLALVEYYNPNYSIPVILLSVALFIVVALLTMRNLKFKRVN